MSDKKALMSELKKKNPDMSIVNKVVGDVMRELTEDTEISATHLKKKHTYLFSEEKKCEK